METEEGKRLAEALQESARTATDMVDDIRAAIAGQDLGTRERIDAFLGEITAVADEILAMQDHIPAMEAETRYLAQACAEQEARGEQVPAIGAPGYEAWEAAQFTACACPERCPIHG
ncbi:hypothetical protein AB0D67_37825 [Streptosporangium sp. NPDC048047]|uniref:hypothetical protein n=1 Tax=Streptosporangium sp. NPDC048047 TaxID=3155748 RepID=UPI00341F9DBD